MQREEDLIGVGDVVEHKMNSDVFGIVIGFMGSLVAVRVSPTLATLWFHEWELQILQADQPENTPSEEDNLVDFTKAKELRANTKTRGVA